MRSYVAAFCIALAGIMSAPAVQAQDNPWMVRFRAVNIDWKNGQKDGLQTNLGLVEAKNLAIPEVDISYFVTKNIAFELVLTYPQKVKFNLNGGDIQSVKALPPSFLVQYHFTNYGAFKPYVGIGFNYTLFSDRGLANEAVRVDKSSFGPAAQIGFDYMLDKHWGLNFDVKYAKIESDVTNTSNGVKRGTLDLSPTMIGAGLVYKF